jgi:hypothetical protein
MAGQAKEQVQAQAGQLAARASGQVHGQIDTRSSQAADQIAPFAQALHRAGAHLQQEGNDSAGRAAHRLGDRLEHLCGYLRDSRSDRFLGDLESFARRRPWVAGGLGTAVGFMGARFLKASSEGRYSASGRTSGRPDLDWPMARDAEAPVSAHVPAAFPADDPGGL